MVGSQATGTQVDSLRPSIYLQADPVDVWHLAHVGPPLGVADIVAEHAGLSTHSALGHSISS